MKRKIQKVQQQLAEVISRWDEVDTLTLMQNEYDLLDPYFFLSLDVYYRGQLPGALVRGEAFEFAGGFESAGINRKDRFLVEDIPVRLEYKDISRFDSIIHDSTTSAGPIRDSGTYMFHRIMESEVIFSRSPWLEEAKARLSALGDSFWENLRLSAQSRMEHYLADLAAAVVREDELFYLISASGFIRSICGTLFAINRNFEPAPRQLQERSLELEIKPDDFPGLMESFVRHTDTSLSRKREIAELLAKRIIQL